MEITVGMKVCFYPGSNLDSLSPELQSAYRAHSYLYVVQTSNSPNVVGLSGSMTSSVVDFYDKRLLIPFEPEPETASSASIVWTEPTVSDIHHRGTLNYAVMNPGSSRTYITRERMEELVRIIKDIYRLWPRDNPKRRYSSLSSSEIRLSSPLCQSSLIKRSEMHIENLDPEKYNFAIYDIGENLIFESDVVYNLYDEETGISEASILVSCVANAFIQAIMA